MSMPSVKALLAAFPKLDRAQAEAIRSAMATMTRRAAMDVADTILQSHGVQYIPHGHNAKSPSIYFCNNGHSYRTTILCVRGRYRIGAWGDIVERGNYD